MTTPTSGGPIGGHLPGLIGSIQPPRQSTSKTRSAAAKKPAAKKNTTTARKQPSAKRGK